MAQNTTIQLAPGVWTLLTDAAVTALTFQNVGGAEVYLSGAVGAVQPTGSAGSLRYGPTEGEMNVALSDLFPGIAADRVYAFAPAGGSVMVSHL